MDLTASERRRRFRVGEKLAAYGLGPPGPVYCDSSALVKLYLPEPHSDDFNRSVEGRNDILVSDLAVTEIVSALARRVREGAVASQLARRVQVAILDRLDDGIYQRLELTREVHRRAEHVLLSITVASLRASDALHLATAMLASAASVASYDVRLRAAARALGLAVHPE